MGYMIVNRTFCKFVDDNFSRNIMIREGKCLSRVSGKNEHCLFHDGNDLV